jgi:CRP-like cAMP-binding protein
MHHFFVFKELVQNIEDSKVLVDAFEMKDFSEGSTLIEQGGEGLEFFVLLEGTCEITVADVGLVKTCIGRTPDCYFGELALLYNNPRAASVVTTTPVRVGVLDCTAFKHIVIMVNKLKDVKGAEEILPVVEGGGDGNERSSENLSGLKDLGIAVMSESDAEKQTTEAETTPVENELQLLSSEDANDRLQNQQDRRQTRRESRLLGVDTESNEDHSQRGPGFSPIVKTRAVGGDAVLENLELQAMCGTVQGSTVVGKFHKCFGDLGDDSPEGEALRVEAWRKLSDENKKGKTNITTLQEVDEWTRLSMVANHGDEDGVELWKHFRPCCVKAFAHTKELLLLPQSIESKEFVEQGMFRLLCLRLSIYAHMSDAFSVLNDNGDAKSMLEVTKDEFITNYARAAKHGFVGMSSLTAENVLGLWDTRLDTTGRGFVRFDTFCNFLKGRFRSFLFHYLSLFREHA